MIAVQEMLSYSISISRSYQRTPAAF